MGSTVSVVSVGELLAFCFCVVSVVEPTQKTYNIVKQAERHERGALPLAARSRQVTLVLEQQQEPHVVRQHLP